MGRSLAHRGSPDDMVTFGQAFVDGRLAGFNKDMGICLTPKKLGRSRPTHAYFPALATCCATMEYLTGLFKGNIRSQGWPHIADWANRFMAQPDYDREVIRVLFLALRHPVAHRGIATGVWIDRDRGAGGYGRRMVWSVLADYRRPSCEVVAKAGVLTRDPPWPCHYTHRVRIHLKRLWLDILDAAERYKAELDQDPNLQHSFQACMRSLYPVQQSRVGKA